MWCLETSFYTCLGTLFTVWRLKVPRVLLQPGGRVGQGRGGHLQGRLRQARRGLRHRARRARTLTPYWLSDDTIATSGTWCCVTGIDHFSSETPARTDRQRQQGGQY